MQHSLGFISYHNTLLHEYGSKAYNKQYPSTTIEYNYTEWGVPWDFPAQLKSPRNFESMMSSLTHNSKVQRTCMYGLITAKCVAVCEELAVIVD